MKILNFGSCNIDYVYSLHGIVRAGETAETTRREVFAGGKGLNQSIAAARAGVAICHAGCVGEDGRFLLEILEQSGVNTRFMRKVDGPSGHAVIQVDDEGENAIFIHAGANARIDRAYIDEVLSHFSSGDLIVLQNEIVNNDYIIDRAYEKGLLIVLNPSPINDAVKKLNYDKLFCIVINEIEGEALTGESDPGRILTTLRRMHPALQILLTLGDKGCIFDAPDKRCVQPAFEVRALDTTAAGDTFTGYFISALSRGAPTKKCLKEACAAAALAVSRMGAAPSIPTYKEMREALKTLKIKKSESADEQTLTKIDGYFDAALRDASLTELSKLLGYSTYYTGRIVKSLTGKAFSEYLCEKRCGRAAQLLVATDMPISAIIHEIGYNNESFFRTKFKAAYGQMPLQYRRTMRQKND